MSNYLDEQGLALLWNKIVARFNSYVPNIPSLNADEIGTVFNQSVYPTANNNQENDTSENEEP